MASVNLESIKGLSLDEVQQISGDFFLQNLNGTLDVEAAFAWWLAVRFLQRKPERPQELYNDFLISMRMDGTLHDPLRRQISDKFESKGYYRTVFDERHIIPTLGIYESVAEAKLHKFARPSIIKPSHASGLYKIIGTEKEGNSFDWEEVEDWWRYDYYKQTGEANYFGLTKRVIVEPLLSTLSPIDDYKVICWKGEPKLWYVYKGRGIEDQVCFFDPEWNQVFFNWGNPWQGELYPKPKNLHKANELIRKVAKPFDYIRVDLYLVGDHVLIGELTNLDAGGLDAFRDEDSEIRATNMVFC